MIWFVTIWLVAHQHIALATLAIWLWGLFFWQTKTLRPYFRFLFVCLGVGLVVELTLAYLHIAKNIDGHALYFPPLWLLGLWGAFGSLLPFCLQRLHNRYLLATMIGAIFGPLSYRAGSKLGALNIEMDGVGLSVVALLWAISFPLLIFLFRGFQQQTGRYE